MIVCSCHAITDRQVGDAIRAGARTLDDLGLCCAAGTGCGSCRPMLEAMLAAPDAEPISIASLLRKRPRPPVSAPPPSAGRFAGDPCRSAPVALRSGTSSNATVLVRAAAGEAA